MDEKEFLGDESMFFANQFIFERMQIGQIWRVSSWTASSTTVVRCRKLEKDGVDDIIYN